MYQVSNRVLSNEREMELKFKGEFDGLQAFEDIYASLPPNDSCKRIVLDFSSSSRVNPLEVHYLLSYMAGDTRFSHTEIRVEGLQFNHAGQQECLSEPEDANRMPSAQAV